MHYLKEQPNQVGFGVTCLYDQANHCLHQVIINAPKVWARDAHVGAGNDPQWVGWRAKVQRSTKDGWQTIWTSRARR